MLYNNIYSARYIFGKTVPIILSETEKFMLLDGLNIHNYS